eukprot:4652308-Karenia_brevis.AAC.1
MKDGDLWQLFWGVLCKKGHQSVRISKVKGHAEYADVQHDPEKLRLKIGNDRADHIATHTYQATRGSHVVKLSKAYQERFEHYTQFVASVHCIIARMYLAVDKLRNSEAFKLLRRKPDTT